MTYCIDTSAILTAWRRNYPPDIFPSVWDRVDELINQGELIASEEVLVELERKDDEVYAWATERQGIFVPIDDQVQQVVRRVLASYPRLLDTRRNRSGADPFVIALARVRNCTVVTNEAPSNSPSRPTIPDVCQALGILCIDFIQMARQEGWRI